MPILRSFVWRAASLLLDVKASQKLRHLKDGEYLLSNVPYQCQFPSSENVARMLEGNKTASDGWETFGFTTKKEATYWSHRACGIACVKMLTDYYGQSNTMAALTNEGVQLGGYDTVADRGWYYGPLVNLLAKHGVKASVMPYMSVNMLAYYSYQKKLCIASVNPQIIRFDKVVTSEKKEGHLVLVTGVRIQNGRPAGYFIHNPSGKTPDTQCSAYIPFATFVRAFGQRGILVQGKMSSDV